MLRTCEGEKKEKKNNVNSVWTKKRCVNSAWAGKKLERTVCGKKKSEHRLNKKKRKRSEQCFQPKRAFWSMGEQ